MKAPKITTSMSEQQAKEGLQSAINKLAELYSEIGSMTIEQLALHPSFGRLVEEYQSGAKYLETLADDEIPF